MKKSFTLFTWKKGPLSEASKKRLGSNMRNQVKECEWLEQPSSSSPESALSMAVLQRAVLDLITPGIHARDKMSAFEWISGAFGDEYEREYALSFSRIVESFTDIGIEEFRSKILSFASQAHESQEVADGFRFQRG
jgi:hypothetical protein